MINMMVIRFKGEERVAQEMHVRKSDIPDYMHEQEVGTCLKVTLADGTVTTVYRLHEYRWVLEEDERLFTVREIN